MNSFRIGNMVSPVPNNPGSDGQMTRPCILVVDDEERNLLLMKFLLESFGYASILASSGEEALEKLGPGVDLVLLDVMLKGLDGFQIARRIRSHPEYGDLPIVMVTVLSGREDRLQAVQAGANDFVTKPVDKVELRVRMESLLQMKEARDKLKRYHEDLETIVKTRTEALAASEARYRMLVENAPVGIISCDLSGNVVDANCQAQAIFGSLTPEKRTRANVLTDPSFVAAGIAKYINRCLAGGKMVACEGNCVTSSQEDVFLRLNIVPLRDGEGAVIGAQAIVEDATEEKKVMERLRESERRFRAVFETALDCIFIKDRELRYTHVNPAMLNLLGIASEEFIGRTDGELYGEDQARSLTQVDARVLEGQAVQSEHAITVNGRLVAFNCVKVPLTDHAGETVGLCGIAREVTQYTTWKKFSATEEPLSAAMRATLESARLAARSDSIVLLMGESGSGKDYVAKYLHENSPRSGGPFFTINCAALPPELAESELFGHEPGAFSGAKGRKRGLLELAEGGTLLLNEIGELALALQAKLLTFLDTQSFTRVGGERSTTVNARLLAATNRDLEKEVAEGRFRQDLFYRINVICITVPPLRDRVDDLPILVRDLTAGLCKKLGFVEPPLIHQKCLEIFTAYKWPGNVRELKNVLERALILSQGREIDPHAIGFPLDQAGPTSDDSLVVKKSTDETFNDILRAVKRNLIEEALRRSGGNRTRAASMLGLSRYALKHYIKALAIE